MNDKKRNERALSKRKVELALLEEFLVLEGISHEEIVPVDPPSDPLDFIVTLAQGNRVGIELVGVDNKEQRRNNSLIDGHIVPGIARGLKERGVAVSVQLMWKQGLTRFAEEPKRIDSFIRSALDLVCQKAPNVGDEDVVLSVLDEDEERQLCAHGLNDVDSLAIQRVENLNQVSVLSFPLWLSPTLDEEGDGPVINVLEKKEMKLAEYRKRAQGGEVWLLIVTGAAFEQHVVASKVETRNAQTGFDRVYLLDLRERRVERLK